LQKTSLLKGTFYIGISQIIFILSGYVINFWLARYLGPNNYGIYGVIISFLNIIRLVSTGGFTQAVSKYCTENENLAHSIKTSILRILTPFSIFIAIICYFFSPLIAIILKDNKLIPFIRISVPVIPLFTIYAIFQGYFNGLHLFNKQSYLSITYSLLKLIFIILLSTYFGLYGTIVGFIVALIGTILVGILFSEKGKVDYFNSLKLIKFALPIGIYSIAFLFLINLNILMVKSILRENILTGYYNASLTISNIPIFILSGVFGSIILPSTSNSIKRKSMEKTKNLINRWIKLSLIISLPILFLFSFTSSKLINFLYSEQYSPSSKTLSILIYGMVLLAISDMLATILKGAGKPNIPMIIALVSLILNFILNLYLIPNYQLIGAAISTSFIGLLVVFLTSYIIYKEFKTLISFKSFLKIILASLITSVPLIFITLPKYLLPIEYMFSIVIYFIVLYFIKEITREDIEKIRQTLITFIPWL